MKNFSYILLLAIFMISTRISVANNITVSNVSLTGQNTTAGVNNIANYSLVQFDLSWENSWRTSSAPFNWDAAWVFVKYKVNGNYVSAAGAASSGTTITVTSTTGLRVGMPVSVTAGFNGTIASGTVVTSITDATHFIVSAAPSPVLSGTDQVTGIAIWEHATLNSTGHTVPTGSTITPASDGIGIFIYRNADGTGTNTFTGAQLRWNYGVNGVADGASADIQVFAIEMVYVPTGSFYVGDGTTINITGQFNNYNSTNAFQITSESVPATLGGSASGNMRNNNAAGMDTNPYPTDDFNDITTQSLPTAFPKGYNAFYCMKYEMSQQQYVDFLNSLTQTQATARKFTSSNFRYTITGDLVGSYATTNPYVACNNISWSDMAAYLDWSGLRPMTELEFEKACRGTVSAVANECAWGTTGMAGSAYTLSNSSANNESIASNYYLSNSSNYVSAAGATSSQDEIIVGSTTGLTLGMPVSVTAGTGAFASGTVVQFINDATSFYVSAVPTTVLSGGAVVTGLAIGGNASYSNTTPEFGSINGPLRVGIFAGTSGNTGRITAGATYYGIMEMSGNLWERPVTVGNVAGRSFNGLHGDGTLNKNGEATVDYWPGINGNVTTTTANTTYLGVSGVTGAAGSGYRGSSWLRNYLELRVSDRYDAAAATDAYDIDSGCRGVRLAP
jgi:formylglycine-generating enzyme required for sulfatase activity